MKILEIYGKKLRFKGYSKRTIDTYSCYLERFLIGQNIYDPYQVSIKNIKNYLESEKYSSISQQNQIIGSLKLFAKYILGKKSIHLDNIERPKKEKKLPRVIDNSILKTKLNGIINIKHRAILSLGYSCGLRVSEVIDLKIEDIDSDRMLIHIRNAKGRKDRVVPLSENILALLRDYYLRYRPNVYLFNGQSNLKYSTTSCNSIFKKYIDSTGSFHILRHSCFTHLLESGVDLRIIQKIAGHSSSKTTEIYTHVSNNLLSKIKLPI